VIGGGSLFLDRRDSDSRSTELSPDGQIEPRPACFPVISAARVGGRPAWRRACVGRTPLPACHPDQGWVFRADRLHKRPDPPSQGRQRGWELCLVVAKLDGIPATGFAAASLVVRHTSNSGTVNCSNNCRTSLLIILRLIGSFQVSLISCGESWSGFTALLPEPGQVGPQRVRKRPMSPEWTIRLAPAFAQRNSFSIP
jgi:hypothetical protein